MKTTKIKLYAVLYILAVFAVVMPYQVVAYENLKVIETYPDGQPKYGTVDWAKGTTEVWWNPYGQAMKAKYRGYTELILEAPNAINEPNNYLDANGYIVRWDDGEMRRFDTVSENKALKIPPFKQAGISPEEYQVKFGVNKTYMNNVANYQTIYNNIYNLTPEFQNAENIKMRAELENMNIKMAQTRADVEKQATLLEKIHDWINQTFGIDLW